MDFSGYAPFVDKELGGGADYDNATVIPNGLATICRNMRFRKKSVRMRDGYKHTMSYQTQAGVANVAPWDFTGVEALDVLVNNPQQVVLALSGIGTLMQEFPVGTGIMNPIATPIPLAANLPQGISMQTAKAYNRVYMAFSDLVSAQAPPMVEDGPTGVVSPVSQNPIGAIWTPGRYALVGDLVRTSQNPNRWFRCIIPGLMGNTEPAWPTLDGYCIPGTFPTTSIISIAVLFTVLPSGPVGLATAVVNSTLGFTVGSSITVTGNSNAALNGTFVISAIGSNTISWIMSSTVAGNLGTSGTAVQTTGVSLGVVPAIISDSSPVSVSTIGYSQGDPIARVATIGPPGVVVGHSITISGNTNPVFNGTFVVDAILASNIFAITFSNPVTQLGVGGNVSIPTNFSSQWIEWTPAVPQFLPSPEPIAKIVSIQGQPGAPVGSITGNQDVYVCCAYQNANGESAWTQPVVYQIPTGPPVTNISSITGYIGFKSGSVFVPTRAVANVSSTAGFNVGDNITVAGNSNAIFNGVWTVYAIGINQITWAQNAVGGLTGTGGTVTDGISSGSPVLEVFFQNQNDTPGPALPATFGAAGYGGPRMPQWLISVLGLPDPTIAWPNSNCLNVYVAAVTHGDPVPLSYYRYLSGASVGSPVVISSIPSSGTLFTQRSVPTAALTKIPYVGEGGPRYFCVGREDLNESQVAIDPGSSLLVNFASSVVQSGTANITFIQRTSTGVVTCTVDQLAGFAQGGVVVVAGVTDTSFDGTFNLTGVSPNQYGGATLIWTQGGSLAAAASTGGTATSASGAAAFVTPQDLIATISRTSNVVTAIINSLSGLQVGTLIAVSGVSDASFNGQFTISTVTANLGGGGTITWAQTAADSSGTGGVVSPTGVSVGTNTPQTIGFLARNAYPASPGAVIAIIFLPQGTQQHPPPGYVIGAQIVVAGVTDASFNGTFKITNATPNPGKGGGYSIGWNQPGATAKYNPAQGTITLLSGAPIQQAQGNVVSVTRAGNVVTATVDNIANFVLSGEVQVTGVTNSSYNGTFAITSINIGASQLQWTQPGANSSSTGGSIIQTGGGSQQPAPVAILPPGGPFISADILGLSVQGGSPQGPFTFLPSQDPVTPFSANVLSIGAVNGTVTALLDNTSGIQPGNTVQLSGTPNGWFDGVFVLAQITGNVVVWAGVGPGTGYAGGTLSLIPSLPTIALGQNTLVAITSMARASNGIVTAQISDVSNLQPGMRIAVAGTSDGSFSGLFNVLSVSQNQLPGSITPLAGTATWQSGNLFAASSIGGYITGIPGIIYEAIDNDLANGDDLTVQLSNIGAPSSVNVYFSQNLNMMVYTTGQDSSHYFSNPGDAANIASPGGILGVNESNGERTVAFAEMVSGELLSLKEKSGYEITVGSSTPNEYGVSRRWFGHGPCGPRAWDLADDFLVYFDEDDGLHRYHQGVSMQVGQEKQGTWDRLNKAASAQVCVAVDNVRKEIHVLLPLDGATVPNHDLVLNYFNGWEEPLMLTMSGEMMPNPHGRRWSDNDCTTSGGSARLVKVLKRALPSAPMQISKRQVVFCLSGISQTTGATGYIDISVPEQFNDNNAAIQSEYQPAFAQSPTCERLLWDKSKGRILGDGEICLQPLTEDPTLEAIPTMIDLSDELPDSFETSFGEVVNELFALNYSNRDSNGNWQANTWFEIHKSVKYGKVKDSGTPRGQ